MKTKFCVFNDRNVPMRLQIDGIGIAGCVPQIEILGRQTMKVVEIEIPEGTIAYLKIWENGQALLSCIIDPTPAQSES